MRSGFLQKTAARWKKRTSTTDVPTGPKEPKSTLLTIEKTTSIVAFRRHTLLAQSTTADKRFSRRCHI